ncbi:MAG TPA: zinc-dependent alcohol dehydrogenase family protein [Candidatus Obscuribacter sp.]|nr:zinc-dependent alcohol dehydrogenase family protein [Candidatus Obscuribacter sp.]
MSQTLTGIIRFHSVGGAEVLQYEQVPVAEPAHGEVRIKILSLGLNRAEVLLRQGLYLEKPVFPSRIGYEACGIVEAIGEGCAAVLAGTGIEIGSRVSTVPCFSQAKYGVYGETAVVPARSLVACPANLSDIEGSSIWMQYLTAYGAIKMLGDVKPEEYVLITAASSSVGYAAIQLVNREGAIAIATTRSVAKKEALLKAGAAHVIVTETEDLVAEVKRITAGKGASIVFDAVAGPMMLPLARAAAYEGKIFIYGALSLESTTFPLQLALKRGLSVCGYTMFQVVDDAARFARAKEYVLAALADGSFKPVIDKVFSYAELRQAQEYMESNQQQGKIVVALT